MVKACDYERKSGMRFVAIWSRVLNKRCRCKKCKGKRVVKEKKRVDFQIEPGTEDGERIALRGEGDELVRLLFLRLGENLTTEETARGASGRRDLPYPTQVSVQVPPSSHSPRRPMCRRHNTTVRGPSWF